MNVEIKNKIKYYIKKSVYQGSETSIVELIYLTKETTSIINGFTSVTPETLATHYREIPLVEAENNEPPIKVGEETVFIPEETALNISQAATSDDKFLQSISLII